MEDNLQLLGLPSLSSLPTILSNIIAAKTQNLTWNLPFNPVIHNPVNYNQNIFVPSYAQDDKNHRETTPIDIPIFDTEVIGDDQDNDKEIATTGKTIINKKILNNYRKEDQVDILTSFKVMQNIDNN